MARGAALGVVSQPEEVRPTELGVTGSFPSWLSGSLVRSTPAIFEVGGVRIEHWFDGLALLNAFSFRDGSVTYASRRLQTGTSKAADAGTRIRRGFANDPCMGLFSRALSLFDPSPLTLTDNANVNVGRLGDQWVALTEAPMPIAFDPESLETLGLVEHRDELGYGHGTPHPHYDERGAMVSSMLHVGVRPRYHLYETGLDGTQRRELASLATREPSYMHSFAMTEHHLVLIEQPWVIDPLEVVRSGRPLRSLVDYFTWKPQLRTRLRIFSRRTGHLIRTAVAPAMFLFHTINAFDEGDDVIVDVAAYDDPSIVQAFYLETMVREDSGFPVARPRRLRTDLRTGEVRDTVLADVDFELPVIDYGQRNGRPYRFAYAVGRRHDEVESFWNQIVKLDVDSGETRTWHEPGTHPSEPVFVASPDRRDEDDGVLLSVVLDHASEGSFLLALNARNLRELGRAAAPQRIPLGFHSQHVPAAPALPAEA